MSTWREKAGGKKRRVPLRMSSLSHSASAVALGTQSYVSAALYTHTYNYNYIIIYFPLLPTFTYCFYHLCDSNTCTIKHVTHNRRRSIATSASLFGIPLGTNSGKPCGNQGAPMEPKQQRRKGVYIYISYII